MRIAMVGWEAPYMFEYGGLSTFNRYLIKALLDMGHEVLWIGLHPDPRMRGLHRTDMDGYRIYIVDTPGTLDPRGDLPRVWARLSDVEGLLGDIDLLVIHDFHLAPIALYTERYNVDTRLYLHIASLDPVESLAILRSTHVYTNSQMMMEKLVKPHTQNLCFIHNHGLPVLEIVYPAPPEWPKELLDSAEMWRDWARKQYDLGGEINALVFGRNQDNKMTPHLFDAIGKLWDQDLKLNLVVAGRGWPEYRRGWLRMMGELPEDKKLALMMEADLFILPSRFEPFGMVVLEAIEAGVQHIALSIHSGAKEVVEAPTFNPDNTESIIQAIREALETKAEYRQEYRGWSWRKAAEKIIS
ncbi:MAG: glycosyltransferase family 4 protein [Crenarchaeota archaeon]|nr:glycosyltransferase family 4 protein [Thermoproteota archaeon]